MAKKKNFPEQPEWSHMIDADKITAAPKIIKIFPNAEERKRLAKRLGILALEDLQAELTLSRDNGNLIVYISGHTVAHVKQSCVLTAEPIKTEVIDTFEAWYADPAQAVSFIKAKQEREAETGGGEMPILEERDDPEPIIEGKIDLGELVAQYLSLAIDPYPHAKGAKYKPPAKEKASESGAVFENPFAALKDWKQKLGKTD